MTTPEDKLAALLREQAETVVPAGDGLSKIQQRVAARRKARWLVVPGAALVTAAAVSAFFVFGTSDDRTSLRQVVSPGPSATASPSPSASPDGFVGQPFAPAIWPFASHDQAEAWRQYPQGKPWAGDNLGVAQHFVDDYLKLTGVHLVQTCNSCDVVQILGADDQEIGTIGLVREDDGSPRAYSVAGVTFGSSFTVTSPTEGQKVTSPLQVKGTIVGVDENVAITLVTQDGRVIGSNGAPAGSGAPWSTTLTWTDSNWYTGALVLKTYSPRDGSLNRLIVLRVVRAT